MRIRHIEVFHAVYVNGSVTAAARALNVSQPSVTTVLRHAEQLLGFPLFVRGKGRLMPTEDAHTLFGEVSDIQERLHALRQTTLNIRHGRTGVVRVAALPSLGLAVVPDAIARFRARHKGVSFDLQTTHHDEMLRRLYERETDIVVGFEVPPNAPVANRKLGQGELVAMYREDEFSCSKERVSLPDLVGRSFISPLRSGPLGQLLSAEMERVGVQLDEAVSARTFYIAASLVRWGLGLTIVDNFTAQATLSPGLAYRALETPITFGVYAIFLQNRPPSALATAFLRQLSDVIADA